MRSQPSGPSSPLSPRSRNTADAAADRQSSTHPPPAAATLRIDRPVLANGAAVDIVRGALFVDGYAAAADGIAGVTIDVDGQYVAVARRAVDATRVIEAMAAGEGREVVRFAAMVPAWALGNGPHRVKVALETQAGPGATSAFTLVADRTGTDDGPALRRKMPLSEAQIGGRILSGLGWRPVFGILIGVGEVDAEIASARRTLASLRDQAYGGWRATIVRRGRIVPDQAASRLLEGFDGIADRVAIGFDAPASAGLGELARAGKPGIVHLAGVLLAGDILSCDALLEMAIASGLQPDAELFYCDERRTDPVSGRSEIFCKPQWSPDLLMATNYIGRFWCTLPGVLHRARATMGDWFQFGDYDLVLRCTEATSGIHHVAKLLCERGRPQLDHPDQEVAALVSAMSRRHIAGVVDNGAEPGHYRLKRTVGTAALVSVVIAVAEPADRLGRCVERLRATTSGRDIEIICVVSPSAAPAGRQQADAIVMAGEGPFNRSRFNNLGARKAKGEFLLFMGDGVTLSEPGWLDALLEHAQREEVGAVGPLAIDPGCAARPGAVSTERNVSAVSGGCLLVRRSEFVALGEFDEAFAAMGDADFCLRCRERGKTVICTPHARVAPDDALLSGLVTAAEEARFAERWGRQLLMGDPFRHRALRHDGDESVPDPEPVELVYASRPLFDRRHIRNILAVKLDHIGDFVTAIPALRRLQQHFPHARLYLLSSPGVAELSDLVPGLAGTIEFEFFFARSGLGRRQLSDADFRLLRQRLHPYRFDLAIDLRKAPETRPVLRESGARWLAGFDHDNQFPWLDIVMPWETDPPGVPKRTSAGDDLRRLADAVAGAAEGNAELPRVRPGSPRGPAAVTGRKTVCIHPGVGSTIRQWPAAHFAALIDLLAAGHDVEILLIGSKDEAAIADDVMARAQRADVVRSLVGDVALAELPALLSSVDLFVGNNSGPKHLAAALGVPTVGIHSGTVDAREWGPVGETAVAIRKRMVCSPCYFSDARDCPRDLACLTEVRPVDVYEVCRRFLMIEARR
ncbi:MAG TPA: glycosyltransferase family 9 protein [Stellaceae bacterium]|nr:glycosyltransferase family 9 protein [Stellaceae bacterium]